jgi:hypothetical protein
MSDVNVQATVSFIISFPQLLRTSAVLILRPDQQRWPRGEMRLLTLSPPNRGLEIRLAHTLYRLRQDPMIATSA